VATIHQRRLIAIGRHQRGLQEIAKRLDLTIGGLSRCDVGNRMACRERADESCPVADCWADQLTEARQFLYELSPLKRSPVNTIGHENHAGVATTPGAYGIDDF